MITRFTNNLKLLFISVILLSIGGAFLWQGLSDSNLSKTPPVVITTPSPTANLTGDTQDVMVIRVIDGDTVEVAGGQKVRLIGIDTPETVDPRRPVACFGKEASAETKKLVEGKTVRLVKDVSQTDKFGRLLRYVYLKQADGSEIFVNDYLVRQGFAKADTYPPDVRFADQFVEAQREARENSRGLWQKCP